MLDGREVRTHDVEGQLDDHGAHHELGRGPLVLDPCEGLHAARAHDLMVGVSDTWLEGGLSDVAGVVLLLEALLLACVREGIRDHSVHGEG